MTLRKLDITVRDLAKRIIGGNPDRYGQEFPTLIPEEILVIKLNDENLFSTSELIDDKSGFPKQDEMAKLLGLPENWVDLTEQKQKWVEAFSSPDKFTPEQKKVKREMDFLSILSATVANQ